MNQSYSESDVSLSPSKIFERLQMLRQLQIMQRGKLQKHNLQYQDSPEISSSVTEIVSHFSNSTSYNTFRSLLQSSQEIIDTEDSSCLKADVSSGKAIEQDYIEGVSALNLSQESEFITNSPISSRSVSSKVSRTAVVQASDVITSIAKFGNPAPIEVRQAKPTTKQQIALDEMPILSPKKNFEELIIEKLKCEKNTKSKSPKNTQQHSSKSKKPFLRRGEGMARFGLRKNDLVIQNTKALPWRKSSTSVKTTKPNLESNEGGKINTKEKPDHVQIVEPKPKVVSPIEHTKECNANGMEKHRKLPPIIDGRNSNINSHSCNGNASEAIMEPTNSKPSIKTQGLPNVRHPVKIAKGQTWASVLTKEQDMFLRQLKQSDYYKNFVSPAKSSISESSCNETPLKLRQDKERAEQNMFELLENKVTHESFNLNNSFFNRFLRKNKLECSGESTPIVMQKCLYDNPSLLHLHHEGTNRNRNISCCDGETCSILTEGSETCSSVSTCCSCKKSDPSTINQSQCNEEETKEENIGMKKNARKEEEKLKENEKCPDDSVKKDDGVNTDMVEMNAKLIATSELLKDRLRELEDEIETFRKENANLSKMREELDIERQKFYEEKTTFEQKYNEEKILSEYYLAEEKEKLNKQKQIYDRYVREMRGRLNKKDKEEVINLKREIIELKEDIRNKDAKSASTIARLRNQFKIIEKERKTLQDEIEKLKKENRRIQHSNDITRRLTNLKYLEQINKKLTNMSSKDVQSETDVDINQKYKAFEIERQSRIRKPPPAATRRRAKSVPNLNVTSRYAKYFSKKDCASDKEADILRDKHLVINNESDTEEFNNENEDFNDSDVINENDSGEENNLEKIYSERFQSLSTSNKQETHSKGTKRTEAHNNTDGFFIERTDSISRSLDQSSKNSLSPYQTNSSEASVNTSRSPVTISSNRSYRRSKSPINGAKLSEEYNSTINKQNKQCLDTRPKSPVSILSSRISRNHRTATVINKDLYSDKSMIPSPEPTSTRTSKTNLNPTEIRKPDGSKELRFPNGNVKQISADGRYSKFIYYNGDVKENFYDEGRIKYFYAETKTYHTTHADGLEVLEFSDGQIEKRYKDGSSEIRLPNGSVRYYDPKNEHVREEWRFPDGAALTVSATGEQRIVFTNGQVEVHAKDHKRREFPDGTVKLVYNDGTSETRYASGRVRIKDKHGNLIMDSAPG